MTALPLGKITVAAAGTPTVLTAATVTSAAAALGITLSPGGAAGLVHKVEVWADPAATGNVFVCTAAGTKMATLPPVANGHCEHWHAADCCAGNHTDPTQFALDVATNGQGAYVTLWVD